jgi:S-formylglutathione hydrolase FrmB
VNLATLQFESEALRRHVTYTAILPAQQAGPAPVLMQLHGFSDDHTAWVNFSNLIAHAKRYPFIIVLPDGGTSFYLNMNPLARYEDFLMQDLYAHVNATFRVKPGPWAIGGLSMGGYGALRLALKYPERFASVWAHSSAFLAPDLLEAFCGAPLGAEDADVYQVAAEFARRECVRPVISFDCGTEDQLLEANRAMDRHLDGLGVAHRYSEHPGGHTWAYWDEHVQAALRQHADVLG